nr:hypothetical protein [Lachnospiraceae bacterium]
MDVVVLFMRVEDKYWGLFLAALVFMLILFLYQRQQGKREALKYLFLTIYGAAAYALFLCPPFYRFVTTYIPELSGYYEVSHAQVVVPVLAVAATAALILAYREGRKKALYLGIGFLALLFVSGDFVYLPAETPAYSAECSKEEKEVLELMLGHAEMRGEEGKICFWGMEELMAKSRLYDSSFQPVYGKDISTAPEKYSENQQIMYQGYRSYDVPTGSAVNISEQLDVLSGPPHLFAEPDCDYVILYDPQKQFADYEEYYGEEDFDAVGYFCAYGYEYVGRTENRLVFYRQEG